jgi:hypothetical protein
MKFSTAILLVCALSVTAHAEIGEPSRQVLGDMGLAGMRIMSDNEGLAIRGHGERVKVRDTLTGLADYRQSVTEFRQHVSDFKTRLAERTSQSAARLSDGKVRFHGSVANFRAKIGSY